MIDDLARMQIEDGDTLALVYPAASSVPVNLSGIHPQEFKVLVCPDPVEEKTKGGIILAAQTAEAEKYATTQGRIIAMAPAAWTFIDKAEWGDGKPPSVGDRVIFAKYAGLRVTSKRDGKDYLLMADKDILATIEE